MNKKVRYRYLALTLFFALATASGYSQIKKKAIKKTVVTAAATPAEIESGKLLLSKSDCLGCHKTDIKLVGPAYKDVAKKYPANETNYKLLTKKVLNGGSGVWGQIPMPPHPVMAAADANKMVKYILSIK